MAKEYDFKVVDVDTISTFEAEVKRLLAESYELHGGVVGSRVPTEQRTIYRPW